MRIKLYSTGCPKCNVLEKKLDMKGIEFELIEGPDPIKELGYSEAPLLVVDDIIMTFSQAMKWLNAQANIGECASCKVGE